MMRRTKSNSGSSGEQKEIPAEKGYGIPLYRQPAFKKENIEKAYRGGPVTFQIMVVYIFL